MTNSIEYPGVKNFQISKREKSVKILFDRSFSKVVEGNIFLNLNSRSGIGEETLIEYLDNSEDFIPIKLEKSNEYRIFNMNDIVYILEKNILNIKEQRQIDLVLSGNIKINVGHFKNLPSPRSRLLDYLNGENRYISFLFKGSEIHINREKILNGADDE